MSKNRNPSVAHALSRFTPSEIAAAVKEDRKVQAFLRKAAEETLEAGKLERKSSASTNCERDVVALETALFMAQMRLGSERALCGQIKRKELLTLDELVLAIGGNRQWVTYALRTGRIFSVSDSDGTPYFPSFFVVPLPHRRALGRVAKIVAGLPAASQLHFFMSKRLSLGATPVEAIAHGRLHEVRRAAASFVEN